MPRKPTGRPRGRPPGQSAPLAPPLWLRLSPGERAEVARRALAAGVSLSAWVRRVVRVAIGLDDDPDPPSG